MFKLLVRALTGHYLLRRHPLLMRVLEDPICSRCWEGDETTFHFLDRCVQIFDRSGAQRTFNRVIRRRVLASGLRCRRPLRVPLLTARHRTARLQWARAHQDRLLPKWRNVLFSDESRFGLVSDDYRERVWRERGGQNRLVTAIAFQKDFWINLDDNYVWGHMKTLVYDQMTPIENTEILKQKIIDATEKMRQNLRTSVEKTNLRKRLRMCVRNNGGHVENELK
nr:unnamed protein product [Callosobruchus chinensis]